MPPPPQILDIPDHMANLANQIYYTDHNTLCVKQAIHEKIESLRAASLSKLVNTVNKNYTPTIFTKNLFFHLL